MWTPKRIAVVVLLPLLVALSPEPASAAPVIDTFSAARVLGTLSDVKLTWNTTNGTQVHIFGKAGDPGSAIGFVALDGTMTFKSSWGIRSFTLGVKDAAGAWKYRSASVDVPAIPSVSITSTNPKTINYFRSPSINSPLPTHQLTWNLNGADRVKMRVCAGLLCGTLPDVVAPTASFAVTQAHLTNTSLISAGGGQTRSVLGPAGQDFFRYELTPCENLPGGSTFCGSTVQAHVRVLPSQVNAPPRQYRYDPMWFPYTVSWTANGGNKFYVDAPTMNVNNAVTTSTSYQFPALQPAGLHTIKVKSCKDYGGGVVDCAFLHKVYSTVAGTVDWVLDVGETPSYFGVASVGGTLIYPSRWGKVWSNCGCAGQTVAVGQELAAIETDDVSTVQLQVGGHSLQTVPWTTDFDSAQSRVINYTGLQGSGAGANGTTLDAAGNIYSVGEFTDSMLRVAGTSPTLLPIPLLHKLDGTQLAPVKPFRFGPVQTNGSNSQDMSEAADGKLWFTQGWSFQGNPALYDHSRVFRFDPAGVDLDTTLQDDRFCGYNLPEDHNGAMGVVNGGGRTWVVEQRIGTGTPSALTHFSPSESAFQNCTAQNNLDYGLGDLAHPPGPAFSPGYCNPDPAVQTGCFEKVNLPTELEGAGHIAYDATENALWIADYSWYHGGAYTFGVHYLGRYDIATKSFTLFPLPRTEQVGLNTGNPWKVLVHGNHVYVTELDDGSIVRLDKGSPARAQGLCDDRNAPGDVARALTEANGWKNPCMSEVFLPVAQGAWQTRVKGNRLYFTVTEDHRTRGLALDPSMFGYIDLNNWGAITQYTGLDTFAGWAPSTGLTAGFGWFDVDPVTGTVAIGGHGANGNNRRLIKLVAKS